MTTEIDLGIPEVWQRTRFELGESLIWDEKLRAFWWVDIHAGKLYRSGLSLDARQAWQFDEALGHVALTDAPNLVVLGLASRLALFDCSSGQLTTLTEMTYPSPGMRINDGRCDRHGNLVFGTMSEGGKGPKGAFWRFNANQGLQKLALPAPAIPNSICFSPDGNRMYFTDSLRKIIHVCDYDPLTGQVSNVRVFSDPGDVVWEPDGSCVDALGGVWNTRWGGHRIVRYHPDGSLDRAIDCVARQPTCPCLGGDNLDTLYATSACFGLAADQQSDTDGAVLVWPLRGVKGLPEGRVTGLSAGN